MPQQSVDENLALRKELAKLRERLENQGDTLAAYQRLARIRMWTWDCERDALEWRSDADGAEAPRRDAVVQLDRRFLPAVPDAPPISEQIRAAFEHGDRGACEALLRSDDGRSHAVELRYEALRDARGRLRGVFGLAQHAAERRRAEQALREQARFFQTLIDELPSAVFYKDTNGVYQGCNATFAQWLGRPREDIVGKSVHDIYPRIDADTYYRMDSELFTAPGKQVYEHPMQFGDGERRDILYQKATYTDAQGRTVGLVGVGTDISDRKHAEQALRESEERYRALVDASPSAIIVVQDGRLAFTNPAGAQLLGFPSTSDAEGAEVASLAAPHEHAVLKERFERLAEGKSNPPITFEIRRVDGAARLVQSASTPVTFNGRPAALVICQDITERKRAEDALHEAERRFAAFFKNSPAGMLIWDASVPARYVVVNDVLAQLNGRPAEEHVGKTIAEVFHDETAARKNEALLQRIRETKQPISFESSGVNKQGKTVHYLAHYFPFLSSRGDLTGVGGFVLDVTDRINAERELRRERDFSSTVLAAADALIIVLDREGRIVSFNRACEQCSGFAFEEVCGLHIWDALILPEERDGVRKVFANLAATSLPSRYENYWRTKNGEKRLIEWSNAALLGPDEAVEYVMGAGLDVTERRRAEQALVRSEARFRSLVEQAADAFFVHDPNGAFVDVNQRACESLGYTREELLAMSVADIDPNFDSAGKQRAVNETVVSRGPKTIESLHRRKDGKTYPVEIRLGAVEADDGVLILAMARDISERKEAERRHAALEEQLRESQKMEAIGQLAGGVAHDFNNILTAILGNVELLRGEIEDEIGPDSSLLGELSQIERSGLRAADLTRQLLAFSRRQLIRPATIDPRELLNSIDRTLRRVMPENIALRVECEPKPWKVRADARQLEQVVMNLVVNARDAMPDGGELIIRARNVVVDGDDLLRQPDARPGRCLLIEVTDTGVGMTHDVMSRVFEPFFTTKPTGAGSGLGLATVHGVVKQSHGWVEVDSAPDCGATFRVYLPTVNDEPTDETDAAASRPGAVGAETVLVCEDDDAVRRLAVRALKEGGYAVLEAPDARQALAAVDASSACVDILVTDVVMPGMNGRQLAETLSRDLPELKILFVSGYASGVIGDDGELDTSTSFLAKPYSSRDLLLCVRELLDGQSCPPAL